MIELPMASPRCCGPQSGDIAYGETNLGSTRAWCSACEAVEHALYSATEKGVFMERICPRHGAKRTPICRTKEWFMARTATPRRIRQNATARRAVKGCPLDCGPCSDHAGGLRLPIFSVTNNCNLQCPICFTHNRPDRIYNKSLDELEIILDHIEATGTNLDMLDLTGGEPSLHPRIFDLLAACAKRPFRRISMNSNGIVIGKDRAFAEKIKASGVQIVLSLDTLDHAKSVLIHGKDIVREKLDALAALEELNIPTALLLVWIPGINEEEVARLVETYLPKGFIQGVTIQNMAYTGQYGSLFSPRTHSTLEDVEIGLARWGNFAVTDFFGHGSYHPFCYTTGYFITDGAKRIPFTRLAPPELLTAGTEESYLLKATPDLERSFKETIDELWASGAPRDELLLLKKFISRFGDADASLPTFFHEMVKTVTIHAHMDADNFDLARIALCGDLVPDESGAMIPACSYNLLYRQKDPRFWVEPS